MRCLLSVAKRLTDQARPDVKASGQGRLQEFE
mgnify:CR=1 FL=1